MGSQHTRDLGRLPETGEEGELSPLLDVHYAPADVWCSVWECVSVCE